MEKNDDIRILTEEKTEFKRELGVFGGISIIGGIMIGSGIFYIGSYVLERVNFSLGLALLARLLGGLISLFAGLCFAELGASMPKAGGNVVYLSEAYHPAVGFMAGFTDRLVGGPASVAAISVALMTVLKTFIPISEFQIKLFAIILIIILTIINLFGIRGVSIIQNISMIAKLVPIIIIIIAAFVFGRVNPNLSIASDSNFALTNNTSIFGMLAMAIVASLWAYDGYTNLNVVAEEIKDPHKNLPRSLIFGIGLITIIYTVFNFAIMKVIPVDEMKNMIANGNLYLGTEVARRVFGTGGVGLVNLGMILAMFGSVNGLILAQPRSYYAMAVEGHFFNSFKKLHPIYKVPTMPIIVQAVFSIIYVLLRNLDELTNLVIVTGMVFILLCILAVPILRKKYPTIERPYKVWFYPLSIIVLFLIFLFLIYQAGLDDPISGAIGFLVPALGIVVYNIFGKLNRSKI